MIGDHHFANGLIVTTTCLALVVVDPLADFRRRDCAGDRSGDSYRQHVRLGSCVVNGILRKTSVAGRLENHRPATGGDRPRKRPALERPHGEARFEQVISTGKRREADHWRPEPDHQGRWRHRPDRPVRRGQIDPGQPAAAPTTCARAHPDRRPGHRRGCPGIPALEQIGMITQDTCCCNRSDPRQPAVREKLDATDEELWAAVHKAAR